MPTNDFDCHSRTPHRHRPCFTSSLNFYQRSRHSNLFNHTTNSFVPHLASFFFLFRVSKGWVGGESRCRFQVGGDWRRSVVHLALCAVLGSFDFAGIAFVVDGGC